MQKNDSSTGRTLGHITAILGLIILLHSGVCFAQDLSTRISFTAKNESLAAILDKISKLSGVNFSYSSQNIPVEEKLSIRVKNKRVGEVLDALLKPGNLEYFIIENQVIIQRRSEQQKVQVTKYPRSQLRTLSGIIRDKTSGEVLIGAYVFAVGTQYGTTSNAYGYYSLSMPEGVYSVMYSLLGYDAITDSVRMYGGNLVRDVVLCERKLIIKPVEVISGNEVSELAARDAGSFRISPRDLGSLPGFAGDADVIRSMQCIPGVRNYGDGSSFYFVRGGARDQNLITVDDAPLFNPSHLFGFFSAITPDAIRDIRVHKDNFPLNEGGRLSSVTDIRIKDGNMKRFGFSGSLGPYTSYLSVEAPFRKEVASFFVSGRVSNINWLTQLRKNLSKSLKIWFFDVNAKINYQPDPNNRFFISMYGGQDEFSRLSANASNTFGITWNNMLGTFRWNHIFHARLFSNLTVYYSKYNYFLFLSKEEDDYWKSAITSMALKYDFSWFPNPSNTLRLGFRTGMQLSDPGNVHFSDEQIQANAPVIPRYNAVDAAVYIGNEQQFNSRWYAEYGFRIPAWFSIGATTSYRFNTLYQPIDTMLVHSGELYNTRVGFDPRLMLSFRAGKNQLLRLAYSHNTQFLQVITNSVSPFTSLEVWVPCGPNIKPQTSDQFSFGFFNAVPVAGMVISAEAYYRLFNNQIDYRDHANLLYNPLIEGEIRQGKAKSFGVELMIRKETGRFTGWLGYTFSRAFASTPGINNGKEYPAVFDSPHNVFVNLALRAGKRWAFAANWVYYTGTPVTTPVSFYNYNGYTVPVYGNRNNSRLPDYHRLDVSVSLELNKPERRYRHTLILTVYNAYGRQNAISVNFDKMMDDNGNFVVPSDMSSSYELVPTRISVAGIVPSLNYKFSF